jgi:hypothetical protein
MTDPAPVFPSMPALSGKKVSAAFDGGRITSDGGVLLLAEAERKLCIADRLAALIPDRRDPSRVLHPLADILRARILAIAAGYEDADDLDALRHDPALKMALGRTPEAKLGLASQPTLSRWENAADIRVAMRLSYEMIDLYCDSYAAPPVVKLGTAKPVAPATAHRQIGCHVHILGAARQCAIHHARHDFLRRRGDGLRAGAANTVHGHGRHVDRNSAIDRTLPRRTHLVAGLDDMSDANRASTAASSVTSVG